MPAVSLIEMLSLLLILIVATPALFGGAALAQSEAQPGEDCGFITPDEPYLFTECSNFSESSSELFFECVNASFPLYEFYPYVYPFSFQEGGSEDSGPIQGRCQEVIFAGQECSPTDDTQICDPGFLDYSDPTDEFPYPRFSTFCVGGSESNVSRCLVLYGGECDLNPDPQYICEDGLTCTSNGDESFGFCYFDTAITPADADTPTYTCRNDNTYRVFLQDESIDEFECMSECPPGTEVSTETVDGSGTLEDFCRDIPCLQGSCDDNATCIETGYGNENICECNDGFRVSSTEGLPSYDDLSFYEVSGLDGDVVCVQVDDCALEGGDIFCAEEGKVCVDGDYTFFCSCPPELPFDGFLLSVGGQIFEIPEIAGCFESCPAGTLNQTESLDGELICEDIPCAEDTCPGENVTCVDLVGEQNLCECDGGYTFGNGDTGPWYDYEPPNFSRSAPNGATSYDDDAVCKNVNDCDPPIFADASGGATATVLCSEDTATVCVDGILSYTCEACGPGLVPDAFQRECVEDPTLTDWGLVPGLCSCQSENEAYVIQCLTDAVDLEELTDGECCSADALGPIDPHALECRLVAGGPLSQTTVDAWIALGLVIESKDLSPLVREEDYTEVDLSSGDGGGTRGIGDFCVDVRVDSCFTVEAGFEPETGTSVTQEVCTSYCARYDFIEYQNNLQESGHLCIASSESCSLETVTDYPFLDDAENVTYGDIEAEVCIDYCAEYAVDPTLYTGEAEAAGVGCWEGTVEREECQDYRWIEFIEDEAGSAQCLERTSTECWTVCEEQSCVDARDGVDNGYSIEVECYNYIEPGCPEEDITTGELFYPEISVEYCFEWCKYTPPPQCVDQREGCESVSSGVSIDDLGNETEILVEICYDYCAFWDFTVEDPTLIENGGYWTSCEETNADLDNLPYFADGTSGDGIADGPDCYDMYVGESCIESDGETSCVILEKEVCSIWCAMYVEQTDAPTTIIECQSDEILVEECVPDYPGYPEWSEDGSCSLVGFEPGFCYTWCEPEQCQAGRGTQPEEDIPDPDDKVIEFVHSYWYEDCPSNDGGEVQRLQTQTGNYCREDCLEMRYDCSDVVFPGGFSTSSTSVCVEYCAVEDVVTYDGNLVEYGGNYVNCTLTTQDLGIDLCDTTGVGQECVEFETEGGGQLVECVAVEREVCRVACAEYDNGAFTVDYSTTTQFVEEGADDVWDSYGCSDGYVLSEVCDSWSYRQFDVDGICSLEIDSFCYETCVSDSCDTASQSTSVCYAREYETCPDETGQTEIGLETICDGWCDEACTEFVTESFSVTVEGPDGQTSEQILETTYCAFEDWSLTDSSLVENGGTEVCIRRASESNGGEPYCWNTWLGEAAAIFDGQAYFASPLEERETCADWCELRESATGDGTVRRMSAAVAGREYGHNRSAVNVSGWLTSRSPVAARRIAAHDTAAANRSAFADAPAAADRHSIRWLGATDDRRLTASAGSRALPPPRSYAEVLAEMTESLLTHESARRSLAGTYFTPVSSSNFVSGADGLVREVYLTPFFPPGLSVDGLVTFELSDLAKGYLKEEPWFTSGARDVEGEGSTFDVYIDTMGPPSTWYAITENFSCATFVELELDFGEATNLPLDVVALAQYFLIGDNVGELRVTSIDVDGQRVRFEVKAKEEGFVRLAFTPIPEDGALYPEIRDLSGNLARERYWVGLCSEYLAGQTDAPEAIEAAAVATVGTTAVTALLGVAGGATGVTGMGTTMSRLAAVGTMVPTAGSDTVTDVTSTMSTVYMLDFASPFDEDYEVVPEETTDQTAVDAGCTETATTTVDVAVGLDDDGNEVAVTRSYTYCAEYDIVRLFDIASNGALPACLAEEVVVESFLAAQVTGGELSGLEDQTFFEAATVSFCSSYDWSIGSELNLGPTDSNAGDLSIPTCADGSNAESTYLCDASDPQCVYEKIYSCPQPANDPSCKVVAETCVPSDPLGTTDTAGETCFFYCAYRDYDILDYVMEDAGYSLPDLQCVTPVESETADACSSVTVAAYFDPSGGLDGTTFLTEIQETVCTTGCIEYAWPQETSTDVCPAGQTAVQECSFVEVADGVEEECIDICIVEAPCPDGLATETTCEDVYLGTSSAADGQFAERTAYICTTECQAEDFSSSGEARRALVRHEKANVRPMGDARGRYAGGSKDSSYFGWASGWHFGRKHAERTVPSKGSLPMPIDRSHHGGVRRLSEHAACVAAWEQPTGGYGIGEGRLGRGRSDRAVATHVGRRRLQTADDFGAGEIPSPTESWSLLATRRATRQVFWTFILLVGISAIHLAIFLVMRWDMSAGAGTTRGYEERLKAGDRKKSAPAWAAWPKPQLLFAIVLLPLMFMAGSGLIATGEPGKVVGGVLIIAVMVPILTGCSGVILAFHLLAFPEERHLYYEIDSSEAVKARWPMPIVSWVGICRYNLPGQWRAGSHTGERMLRKFSVLFQDILGPGVVRIKAGRVGQEQGGILVPLASPEAQQGVKSRAKEAKWMRVQYMPLTMHFARSMLGALIITLMAATSPATDPSGGYRTALVVMIVSSLSAGGSLAYGPLLLLRDQFMSALQALSEVVMYILVAALYIAKPPSTDDAAAAGDPDAEAAEEDGLYQTQTVSTLVLVGFCFVVGVTLFSQIYFLFDWVVNWYADYTDERYYSTPKSRQWRKDREASKKSYRTIADHSLLAKKYASRWMSRALGRSLPGWPIVAFVAKDIGDGAAKRQHLERLAASVRGAELAGEGRVLRALRRGYGPLSNVARTGREFGVTPDERRQALAAAMKAADDAELDWGKGTLGGLDDVEEGGFFSGLMPGHKSRAQSLAVARERSTTSAGGVGGGVGEDQ